MTLTHESRRADDRNRSARRFMGMVPFRRGLALAAIVGSLVEGFLEAVVLAGIARIGLHLLRDESGDISIPFGYEVSLSYLLIATLFAVLARFLFSVLSSLAGVNLATDATIQLREDVLTTVGAANLREVPDAGPGFLQNLVLTWPQEAGNTILSLATYLSNFMIFLGMLAVAFVLNPVASVGLVVALLTFTALFRPLRKRVRLVSKVILKWQDRSARSIAELESVKPEADIYGVSKQLTERSRAFARSEALSRRGSRLVRALISPLYVGSTYGIVLLALYIISGLSSDALSSVGPVLLIVLRSLSYGQSIQHAGSTWATFTPLITLIMDTKNRLEYSQRVPGTRSFTELSSTILEGASFTYEGAEKCTLHPTDLSIARGERVCVIGPSGAGKSTLAMLLLGALRPTEGKLLYNGICDAEISYESLAKTVAFVPQYPALLSGTIAENVRFFRSSISDEKIVTALSQCGLLEEVLELELGIHANIYRFQKALSGGQVQRLALARAIVGSPTLLVLDEPTSSVDLSSEKQMIEMATSLSSNPAVVIVSHRPYALTRVDRLVVVENGRITADGTPDLVRKDNLYVQGLAS